MDDILATADERFSGGRDSAATTMGFLSADMQRLLNAGMPPVKDQAHYYALVTTLGQFYDKAAKKLPDDFIGAAATYTVARNNTTEASPWPAQPHPGNQARPARLDVHVGRRSVTPGRCTVTASPSYRNPRPERNGNAPYQGHPQRHHHSQRHRGRHRSTATRGQTHLLLRRRAGRRGPLFRARPEVPPMRRVHTRLPVSRDRGSSACQPAARAAAATG